MSTGRKSLWLALGVVILALILIFIPKHKTAEMPANETIAPTGTSAVATVPPTSTTSSPAIVAPLNIPPPQHTAPTSTPYKSPAGWKKYTDSKFKFSFSYPPDYRIDFNTYCQSKEGCWYLEVVSTGTMVVTDGYGLAPYEIIELTPALPAQYLTQTAGLSSASELNETYFSSKKFSAATGFVYKGLIKTSGGLGYTFEASSPTSPHSLFFLIPQSDGAWFAGSDDFANDGTHKSAFNAVLNTLQVP